MANILIILGIVVCAFLPLVLCKNKLGEKRIDLILKILSISLFALAFVRCFLNDRFIWVINGGTYGESYYKDQDVLQSLLRWGITFAIVVYPCAVFFSKRIFKNWAIYFCLPVAIVSLAFYDRFLYYFTTNSGRAIMTADWFRHLEFSLELILLILIPLLLRFCKGHRFNIRSGAEWGYFLGVLPLGLLVTVPVTLPQSLFGFSKLYMKLFSPQHIMWLVVILMLFVCLYFAFRFKDRESRLSLCTFLALFLFYHYNQIYLMDLVMSRLPFQLCNLGSYLVLLAIIIRKPAFFDFVLLANVPGAMIAFLAPDVKEGMLSYWNIHFYIEHTWVFVIPLLLVALRVVERPKKNGYKHFFIGFTIYFLFCAASGILANCALYDPEHWFFNKVNYFYLFNTTVLNALPFLSFTYKYPITWGGYTFYPLYMLLIYILYSVFCMAFYWFYLQLCKVGDDHFKMRSIKIDRNRNNGRYKNRVPKQFYED